MRSIPILCALLALLPETASAQTRPVGGGGKLPNLAGNATKSGDGAAPPIKAHISSVTIRYLYDPAWVVVPHSDPELPFTCTRGQPQGLGTDPVTENTMSCVVITVRPTLDVMLSRSPAHPAVPGLVPLLATGKQWSGDCAGTTGYVCTLTLSAPRHADVSFDKQP